MRIAVFHELDFGGAKRAVMEYAKRLKENHTVDLYYVDEEEDRNIEKCATKTFFFPFSVKKWEGKNWRAKLYKDSIELIKLYDLHRKIAAEIKLRNYDFVLVNPSKFTQAPFLLSFLKNKCIYYCQEPLRIIYDPFISNISGIKFPKNIYESMNRKVRKWIDSRNLNSAGLILSNSEFSKKMIKKSYGKSATVCYLGVDTNLFKPLKQKKSIDVLFIGSRENGYGLLEKLSDFFENKLEIKAIFREDFSSVITDKELVAIYNNSKILVALNHNEPFGLIPLEAMACGIPVIAVGEGGYNESIINNKTGYLIARNPHDLYEKINILINNEEKRQGMGKNARENILQNWTWDKSVERFLKIIKHAE